APRFVLAGLAKRHRRVAPAIETRVRKRHRALQRASAARSPSESGEQLVARGGAGIEIDETVPGRKRRIDGDPIKIFRIARRSGPKISKGSRRTSQNVQLRSKKSEDRWDHYRRGRLGDLSRCHT